ncbi:MAG: hypothetical protein RBJ76_01455 [Stenomitos frigidus ULC029]
MNRQVLERGALACSFLALYGWSQPSVSEPTLSPCETAPNVTATQNDCLQKAQWVAMGTAPEPLMREQWGDRRLSQLPKPIEAVYSALLQQGQTLGDRNQLSAAINRVAGIPKNSQHYEMAHQLQEDWSRELLRQATSECQQARVAKAIAMLDIIPASSQLHDRAVELRHRWSKQDNLLQQAIAFKRTGDWQGVIDAIKALEGTPMYQSLPVQELLQKAMTQLYTPDATLLQVATEDLPTLPPSLALPEVISAVPQKKRL